VSFGYDEIMTIVVPFRYDEITTIIEPFRYGNFNRYRPTFNWLFETLHLVLPVLVLDLK